MTVPSSRRANDQTKRQENGLKEIT